MKRHIFPYILLIVGVLSFSSCEDYFGDINVDPDNPITVTPNVLLPQVEVRLAYAVWGDASRYTGILTQHIDGVERQFVAYQNYNIVPANLSSLWGSNLYSGVLMDNRQLLDIAESTGSNYYVGISKTIEAYTLLLITDLFGDAPYTEAFQGTDLLQPKFDTQEALFSEIFRLIGEARTLMAGDAGDGFAPGSDDLLYGGDNELWGKFINVLEARARLHLSKRDSKNYEEALNALNRGGFASPEEEPRVQFGLAATANAPWFQYIDERDDIDVGANFVGLMKSINDPRSVSYGYPLDNNVLREQPIYKPDRDVPLMTFVEQKFIEAEAKMRTTGAGDATQPYLDAIEATFDLVIPPFLALGKDSVVYLGTNTAVADLDFDQLEADFMASEAVMPAGGITLTEIMTHKYIALFGDPEAFSDWRRTGIPALSPNTGTEIPRRLPYGQTEVLSNENTPSPGTVTIFSRVWWDVE